MSILVTGIAGFTGMHAAPRLLERDETVTGIDHFNDYHPAALKEAQVSESVQTSGGRLTIRNADIGDETELNLALVDTSFDRIIHLVAQAEVRYSLENPGACIRSKVAGHLSILNMARNLGVRHQVYASIFSVCGPNKAMPFRIEDRVDYPISL